jgi:CheY-like chemotaxis protein
MRALGALASGVAHDFNNQLTAIMGYATLLRKKVAGKEPKLENYVDTIIKATRVSADLTRQLVGFARKDDAQFTLVDLHKQIDDTITLLKRAIHKSITIEVEKNADSPMVKGDATQLNNALLNLCINARDAMPRGGVLRVSTKTIVIEKEQYIDDEAILAGGEYIEVKITDTGIGMDTQTINRVFEPFFSTKEKCKGTGLGLASVYATVKNHKGTIKVSSQVGKGTTFVLLLPTATSPDSGKALKGTSTLYMGEGEVLLLDENDWVRNSALRILEDLGYKVTGYGKSDTALNHFKQRWRSINLVILDIITPGGKIAETISEMVEINPEVRILLVSGGDSAQAERFIKNNKRIRFLGKPYEMATLSKAIKELMSGY